MVVSYWTLQQLSGLYDGLQDHLDDISGHVTEQRVNAYYTVMTNVSK